jgi:hypothetical protein
VNKRFLVLSTVTAVPAFAFLLAAGRAIAGSAEDADHGGVGAIDFESTAVHELGHALGFTSNMGASTGFGVVAMMALDLFRFRLGASLASFGARPRALSRGGDQVFFAGGQELAFSTGDEPPGDGRQASHWKDDDLTGEAGAPRDMPGADRRNAQNLSAPLSAKPT